MTDNEKDTTPMTETETETYVSPAQKTDIDYFFDSLPPLVGSFASKHNEAPTAASLAIHLARESVGQFALLGITTPSHVCPDGTALAIASPQAIQAASQSVIPKNFGATLGNGHSKQGALVTQFETQSIQKVQGL
jgi:hypothetical protein